MMDIVMQGAVPRGVRAERLTKAVREAFRAAKKRPQGSLSLIFVTEKRIAELNRRYLRKNRPTDVLSFSSRATSYPLRATRSVNWGDILIAPAYAKREAKRRAIPFEEELVRLAAHGALHLLGYDHATEREETRMFELQEEAVERACP